MLRRNVLLGGAMLWLAACGGVGQAVLKTDQVSYAPGSEVRLNLQNESLQPLGYNLCYATLQRHEGGTWTAIPRTDGACRAVLMRLKPGGHSDARHPLPATLPEGEYRYRTGVEWDGEQQELVSNTFNVTSPTTP